MGTTVIETVVSSAQASRFELAVRARKSPRDRAVNPRGIFEIGDLARVSLFVKPKAGGPCPDECGIAACGLA